MRWLLVCWLVRCLAAGGGIVAKTLKPTVDAELTDLHMQVSVLALNMRAVADRITMLQRVIQEQQKHSKARGWISE